MNIPHIDTFSERLQRLRSKKAELNIEITNIKADCALIRSRMQRGVTDLGNAQEQRAKQLLGETL